MTALQAISEPRRQRIVQLVWDRERTAGDVARHFDVTFGAVSQHLKVLTDAGVLVQRREGRQRWYLTNKKALGPLAKALETMWSDRLADLKALAEAEERSETQKHRRRNAPDRQGGV